MRVHIAWIKLSRALHVYIPQLQVYMLMELEPAKEITGGPWYGADSFDVEFIEVLQKVRRKWGVVSGGVVSGSTPSTPTPAEHQLHTPKPKLSHAPACQRASMPACQHARDASQPPAPHPPAHPPTPPNRPDGQSYKKETTLRLQATYSFIKHQGDVSLEEIADFIKEKVRVRGGSGGNVFFLVRSCGAGRVGGWELFVGSCRLHEGEGAGQGWGGGGI